MIKITKQTVNKNKILVKLTADSNRELIQHFWKFINYGDCVKLRKGAEIEDDTGLNYTNDFLKNSGYFRTNEESLIRTLQSISLFEILREKDPTHRWDVVPAKIENRAKRLGLEKYQMMPEENVLKDVDFDEENL